jgi:hypothetical protein
MVSYIKMAGTRIDWFQPFYFTIHQYFQLFTEKPLYHIHIKKPAFVFHENRLMRYNLSS